VAASLLFFGYLLVCGFAASKIRAEMGSPWGYFTPYLGMQFVGVLGGFANSIGVNAGAVLSVSAPSVLVYSNVPRSTLPAIVVACQSSSASNGIAFFQTFTNTVFEQSDSLKPAADLLGQPVQASGWFSRQGGDTPKGSSERLVSAVFAEDVLRDKRNTAAIEVAPAVLMAARVVENKPAGLRPLAEVSEALEKRLRFQRASELAIDEGRKRLADLRAGKDAGSGWSAPQLIDRQKPGSLPEAAVRQVFRADASKLPAFAGVEQPGGGFLLLRVSRVVEPRGIDPNARVGFSRQAYQLATQEQVSAYLAALRAGAKVTLAPAAVERPQ
jgi:peptidyl-prolyl cis-trans isomerase D